MTDNVSISEKQAHIIGQHYCPCANAIAAEVLSDCQMQWGILEGFLTFIFAVFQPYFMLFLLVTPV